MSATTAPTVPFRTDRSNERVTLPRVIRSEWTKLWSLRSTRWSLLLAFVSQAGLGPLIAAITMARWNQLSLGDKLSLNVIDRSLGGWHLAQLAIAILGVMTITGEYHTGHDPFQSDGCAQTAAGALGQAARIRMRDVRAHADRGLHRLSRRPGDLHRTPRQRHTERPACPARSLRRRAVHHGNRRTVHRARHDRASDRRRNRPLRGSLLRASRARRDPAEQHGGRNPSVPPQQRRRRCGCRRWRIRICFRPGVGSRSSAVTPSRRSHSQPCCSCAATPERRVSV